MIAHLAPWFMPFTGFDPMDGDEPRVRLSRDNPITAPSRSPDPDAAPKRSASGSNAVDVES